MVNLVVEGLIRIQDLQHADQNKVKSFPQSVQTIAQAYMHAVLDVDLEPWLTWIGMM
jgi:hypothetical protein